MAIETTETTESNETRRAPARVAVEKYTERVSQAISTRTNRAAREAGVGGCVVRIV